nr:hypothetical protein CFP56_30320 [Quercus suber]
MKEDKTEDVASASISSTVVVSEDQGAIKVLEPIVIEKKLPDLLSLLESHPGGATPEITMVPKLPMPTSPPPVQTEPLDKKQKRDKKGGKGSTEEGEIQEETPLEQAKIVKVRITKLTKELEQKVDEMSKVEQAAYDLGVQVSAPSSFVITASTQPTWVEDQPSKLSEGATTTSSTTKKTPAPDNVPSSAEFVTSGSRPLAEGQSTKAAEKEKGTEDQGAN